MYRSFRALIAFLFATVLITAGSAAGASSRWIKTIDPGGCVLEQLTDAGADDGHFQFHGPDRKNRQLLVGWYRGKESGAYLLDLNSAKRRDLIGYNNAGALSSDGRRALIANVQPDGNRELVELELKTLRSRIIAPHAAADFLGTYAPEGQAVVFNSYRTGRSDIYSIDRGTGALLQLTEFEGYDAHADWSPDARSIVFHREASKGDYDIYVLDIGTGQERAIVAGTGEQAYPAWSPDGQWIAFASDEGNQPGKLDLRLVDSSGTQNRRITRYPGYNAYPAWSADGRWIYFNSERDGKRNVFRLEMMSATRCAKS